MAVTARNVWITCRKSFPFCSYLQITLELKYSRVSFYSPSTQITIRKRMNWQVRSHVRAAQDPCFASDSGGHCHSWDKLGWGVFLKLVTGSRSLSALGLAENREMQSVRQDKFTNMPNFNFINYAVTCKGEDILEDGKSAKAKVGVIGGHWVMYPVLGRMLQ